MRQLILLAVTGFALAACGGGGNDGTTPPPGGTTTDPHTISNDVGNAKVTTTLLPGVGQFPASSRIARLSDTNLLIPSPSSGFAVGTVFIWEDMAYVVTAMAVAGPGGNPVTVRPARFDETSTDLTVQGDSHSLTLMPILAPGTMVLTCSNPGRPT